MPLDHHKIKLLYCPKEQTETFLSYYREEGYGLFSCNTDHTDIEQPVSFTESEKAVVLVGEKYCYNKRRLSCRGFTKQEEQILIGRLKRAVLRVREELVLIVQDADLYSNLLVFFEKSESSSK